MEARRTKWKAFLAGLEGNLDPARVWDLIKLLSGPPPPFHRPLRTLKPQWSHASGKTNAFVQQYTAVNRLTLNKSESSQACHLKKALQLPTAAEPYCSPFTIRELDTIKHAMRSKGAVGRDDIPLPFLRALGPTAKAELGSIFNESFSKDAIPGIWKEATSRCRMQTGRWGSSAPTD